ncbi:hypothetical protein CIB84_011330 [Bambusicola thoracicus]|uniref:Uncharacterized protein n=1 Tax=Bambusicola thoracicus TaxID=9083 RepID=A0A2P4SLF3_BAMTH|nr:hypothetical protein CIB84_011330 [Bambusicola thoracicus]
MSSMRPDSTASSPLQPRVAVII